MFIREKNGKSCIILVYVDDLLMTGDDEDSIREMKKHLDEAFTIKDLGKMRDFLGIEVARGKKGTMLNQIKYALDIVKDAGVEDCSTTHFPFPKGVKLSTDQGEVLEDPSHILCSRWSIAAGAIDRPGNYNLVYLTYEAALSLSYCINGDRRRWVDRLSGPVSERDWKAHWLDFTRVIRPR
jgi:hypothetical protein